MKVCTDACILGAWFAEKISQGSKVLDIGTGSGLLTLMLAQKIKARFDAIEKDAHAFKQMTENIEQSKWKDKINAFMGDAITYVFPHLYDFIICNPPFYENDLKSGNEKKNLAKHDTGLTLETLIKIINENLAASGSFGVLLPFHRTAQFEQLASDKGFHLHEKLLVRQTPQHGFFRSVLHFTRSGNHTVQTGELTIKQKNGNYSSAFTALLKDYYLYL
ncbi:tRNA1(Val) (adenine(37)-N6)-methyltransferase [Agriterribacter sp.]|uniref:tRNA1(Val) (adenine(37)-N6)-methyltransferase n=1 Tax=Agriterribacter sp. TaxID=2821509 RepID=UPI002BD245EB|nr:methyltransferase [Agriterribacter sp.]HTN06451.1 methyltransferase [Agriterribacter sp.]